MNIHFIWIYVPYFGIQMYFGVQLFVLSMCKNKTYAIFKEIKSPEKCLDSCYWHSRLVDTINQ